MASVAYSFHQRCGVCAKISNRSRTAERTNPLSEFNKAVVISERPLQDGEVFQVKIDSKVSTWSGSILIGATTFAPNKFSFPASATTLSSDSWVFNGETLWKDGVRTSYGCQAFTALREGDTVGVMKQGSQLHFFVNGQDQGVADGNLSEETGVYALVDLYGRCTKVTIASGGVEVRREMSPPPGHGDSNALLFHTRCGKEVVLSEGGAIAGRRNPTGEFNNGIVLTNRPLRDSELFEVEITEMVDKWEGSIEMGVTSNSPVSLDFPTTMTNCAGGVWMMSGSGIIHNLETTQDNYGRNLDLLKVGDRVGVMRKADASLVFFVNGRSMDVAARDLPRDVYGVVDVYGRCSKVKITSRGLSNDTAADIERPLPLPSGQQVVDMDQPLFFHAICGENTEISQDQHVAQRLRPLDEFTNATVFSCRPLKADEWFEIVVSGVVDTWNGSVQLGVCKVPPEEVHFEDFSEASDMEHNSWVLSGMELLHEGTPSLDDYALDLDELPVRSKVGVMVKRNGDLHFSLNGSDMGCAAKDVPSGVYAVVDIYGQCSKVSIAHCHDDVQATHVTPAPPTNQEPRASDASVTVQAAAPSDTYAAFHPKCGRNVRLKDNGCVASRVNSYKDGVTFSACPLREGEVFKVELVKLDEAWSGLLRVGLTTFDPSGFAIVPSTWIELPPHTWVMSGSSVVVDGQVTLEKYRRSLSRLQAGDTVGVQRSLDGAFHVHINDLDLGPAVYGIPERVFAVLDLYGNTSCVKAVGRDRRDIESDRDTSLARPEESIVSALSGRTLKLSASHGPNVEVSEDGMSARRTKSYSNAIVVSSTPLPCDHLFQVEIRQLEAKWSGSVMIGVTALLPHQACVTSKASRLQGQSYILCASDKATCLFVGGQEKLQLHDPSVDLLNLKPGGTVGMLCRPSGTLQFYVNGEPIPQPPLKVPKTCYAVVDLYGRCSRVQLQPLIVVPLTNGKYLTSSSSSPSNRGHCHSRARSLGWKSSSHKSDRDKQGSSVEFTSLSCLSKHGACTRLSGDVELHYPSAQVVGRRLLGLSPGLERSRHALLCPYWQLCERFLRSLAIPDTYLDRTPEYNKCYCEHCAEARGEPRVKFQGDPQPMKYSVPLGWVKFAINLHRTPSEVSDIFRKWHVAYHGTAVGNIRPILDDGELKIRGDVTSSGSLVKEPDTHYSEQCKPNGHDNYQIFLSPSLKYCTHGDVYATKQSFRDSESKRSYWAKVALEVRIKPGHYYLLPQTVRSTNDSRIDENFDNKALEWATKIRDSVTIVGLLVNLR